MLFILEALFFVSARLVLDKVQDGLEKETYPGFGHLLFSEKGSTQPPLF